MSSRSAFLRISICGELSKFLAPVTGHARRIDRRITLSLTSATLRMSVGRDGFFNENEKADTETASDPTPSICTADYRFAAWAAGKSQSAAGTGAENRATTARMHSQSGTITETPRRLASAIASGQLGYSCSTSYPLSSRLKGSPPRLYTRSPLRLLGRILLQC